MSNEKQKNCKKRFKWKLDFVYNVVQKIFRKKYCRIQSYKSSDQRKKFFYRIQSYKKSYYDIPLIKGALYDEDVLDTRELFLYSFVSIPFLILL